MSLKSSLHVSALFLTAILGSFVQPAAAQPQCDSRDIVLQILQERYKEAPVFMGVTHNGGLIEVLTSEGGSSWSVVVTIPGQDEGPPISCLVAAGEGWRAMEAVAVDPEA